MSLHMVEVFVKKIDAADPKEGVRNHFDRIYDFSSGPIDAAVNPTTSILVEPSGHPREAIEFPKQPGLSFVQSHGEYSRTRAVPAMDTSGGYITELLNGSKSWNELKPLPFERVDVSAGPASRLG